MATSNSLNLLKVMAKAVLRYSVADKKSNRTQGGGNNIFDALYFSIKKKRIFGSVRSIINLVTREHGNKGSNDYRHALYGSREVTGIGYAKQGG